MLPCPPAYNVMLIMANMEFEDKVEVEEVQTVGDITSFGWWSVALPPCHPCVVFTALVALSHTIVQMHEELAAP